MNQYLLGMDIQVYPTKITITLGLIFLHITFTFRR